MNKQLQRITAFLTAACMSTSFLVPQAFPDIGNLSALVGVADGEWRGTHVIITYWHADGSTDKIEYTIQERDNKPHQVSTNPDPQECGFEIKPDEQYVGYSIGAGSNIVSITPERENTDGTRPIQVEWGRYDEAHLVKINMFYQEIPKKGENFNGADFETIHSELGDITYKDVYIKEDDVTGLDTTVYNTAPGLHTNKTVTNASGRTYDINLESWYASGTPADVGLILDASGSMAFTADTPTAITKNDFKEEPDGDEIQKIEPYTYITPEQLDKILDNKLTDNSLLGYGDYHYYVFDGRSETAEFAPLTYWDGKIQAQTYKIEEYTFPLRENLLGYYSFNGDLENGIGGEAVSNNGKTPDAQNGGMKVTNGNCDLTLDAKLPTSDEFTISFYLCNDNTSNDDKNKNTEAAFLTIGRDGENMLKLYRGATSSKDRLKMKMTDSSGDIINDGIVSINKIFNEKKVWHMVTCVVEGSKVKAVYVDGNNSYGDNYITYKNDDKINLTGDLNIKIGGVSGYKGGSIILKNLAIYDIALSADEVETLYNETKSATKNDIVNKKTESSEQIYDAIGPAGAMGQVKKEFENLKGWYYVNSKSNWDELLNHKTGKALVGVSNEMIFQNFIPTEKTQIKGSLYKPPAIDVKMYQDIKNGNDEKFIFTGNADFSMSNENKITNKKYFWSDAEGSEKLVEITKEKEWYIDISGDNKLAIPEGYERNSANGDFNKGYSPIIFFFDSEEYLRCFFNNGDGSDSGQCSYVYVKDDKADIKTESLRVALGKFASSLNAASSDSRVSAVRFSTSKAPSNKLNNFLLQDWTGNVGDMINVVSQTKSTGTDIPINYFSSDESGRYNYVLTGNTSTLNGFQAFEKMLKSEGGEAEHGKYLILFTDGKDTTLSDAEKTGDPFAAGNDVWTIIDKARELRKEGWTIYSVILPNDDFKGSTESEMTNAEKFIALISGESVPADSTFEDENTPESLAGKENNYYFVSQNNTEALAELFTEQILSKVKQSLDGYTVQDYIDPRFDLSAKINKDATSKTTIHLNDGGEITYDGGSQKLTSTDYLTIYPDDSTGEAKLYYDAAKSMYYIRWENQTIPGNVAKGDTVTVWNATFTLIAKEDFLGGNDILTNGNGATENYVFYPEDKDKESGTDDAGLAKEDTSGKITNYPSKGFPRTVVNVPLLDIQIGEKEDHIYLGEEVTPGEMLKYLLDNMTIGSKDFDIKYNEWNYLSQCGKSCDDLLKAKEGTLTIPYSYLPSGSEEHKNDVIGNLIYTWEIVPEGTNGTYSLNEDFVSVDIGDKTYQLSVKYEPYADCCKDPNLTNRDENNDKLVNGDDDYKWDSGYKPFKGSEVEDYIETEGTYTRDIVNGEILLRLKINEKEFEFLKNHYSQDFEYKANLIRNYEEINEQVGTFTITADNLSEKPDEDGYLTATVYLDASGKYAEQKTLPIGDYTIEYASGAELFGGILNDAEIKFVGVSEDDEFKSVKEDRVKLAAPIDPAEDEANNQAQLGTKGDGEYPDGNPEIPDSYLNDRLAIAEVEPELNYIDWTPSITKELEGRAWDKTDSFEFTLKLDNIVDGSMKVEKDNWNSYVIMKDEENFSETLSAQMNANMIEFNVGFLKEGVYTFEVSEADPGSGFKVVEPKEIIVTVSSDAEADGNLSIAVSCDDETFDMTTSGFKITNVFNYGSVKWTPAVVKVLEGRDWKDGDAFTFTLEQIDGDETSVVMPDVTSVIVKDENAVSFEPIQFNVPGTYQFKISETPGSEEGMKYAEPQVFEVEVGVDNLQSGQLSIRNSKDVDIFTFTFTNTLETTAPPETTTQVPETTVSSETSTTATSMTTSDTNESVTTPAPTTSATESGTQTTTTTPTSTSSTTTSATAAFTTTSAISSGTETSTTTSTAAPPATSSEAETSATTSTTAAFTTTSAINSGTETSTTTSTAATSATSSEAETSVTTSTTATFTTTSAINSGTETSTTTSTATTSATSSEAETSATTSTTTSATFSEAETSVTTSTTATFTTTSAISSGTETSTTTFTTATSATSSESETSATHSETETSATTSTAATSATTSASETSATRSETETSATTSTTATSATTFASETSATHSETDTSATTSTTTTSATTSENETSATSSETAITTPTSETETSATTSAVSSETETTTTAAVTTQPITDLTTSTTAVNTTTAITTTTNATELTTTSNSEMMTNTTIPESQHSTDTTTTTVGVTDDHANESNTTTIATADGSANDSETTLSSPTTELDNLETNTNTTETVETGSDSATETSTESTSATKSESSRNGTRNTPTKTSSAASSGSPQTGDNSVVYVTILLGCATLFVCLSAKRRKDK